MPRGKSMSLFRPVYGSYCEVRPKKWWSPAERRSARTAAKVLDHHAEEFLAKTAQGVAYSVMTGDSVCPSRGRSGRTMHGPDPCETSEQR